MSEEEQALLQETSILLRLSTCNSMDPDVRTQWKSARERVLEGLTEMTSE